MEFLINHKPISKAGCGYCGAIHKELPENILAALSSCTNCRVDIAQRGQWSGYGIDALQKAYILDPLNSAWPKIFDDLGLTEDEDG